MTATAGTRSRRGFLPSLKERCALIDETVRYKKLATDDELAAYKPGGEENQAKDLGAWVFYFANLVRFLGREEMKEVRRDIAGDGAQRTVLDALRDAPVYLELQPIGEAEPRKLAAYPKSFESLLEIDLHDQAINWLNEQSQKLRGLPIPVSAEALAAVDREILHQYQLIVFSATHPGAGLPFPADDPPKVLPEWIRELNPVDVFRIHRAFITCNVIRLQSLYMLLELKIGETQPDRLSWATFFSTRAEESGIEPQTLMRDRSLGSQIATALIAAEARERALAESKNKEQMNNA